MKIAVPSDDGVTIAGHFGKAEGFLFFDADTTCIQSARYLSNNGEACCSHDADNSRSELLEALALCETVIARGMGTGMVQNLAARGVDVFLTAENDARCAVTLYLNNALEKATTSACGCGGGHHH